MRLHWRGVGGGSPTEYYAGGYHIAGQNQDDPFHNGKKICRTGATGAGINEKEAEWLYKHFHNNSTQRQGNVNGTLHPNYNGHARLASLLLPHLVGDLKSSPSP